MSRAARLGVLAAATALCVASPVVAQDERSVADAVSLPAIEPEVLDSGTRLLLLPDRSIPLVSIHVRLRERVDSILGGHTGMEQPRSRTRRLVGNVRLKRVEGELVSSRSNFVVHQFRNREAWNFVGEASHVLRDGPEGLRIVSREIRLDHETISAQRRISIIL